MCGYMNIVYTFKTLLSQTGNLAYMPFTLQQQYASAAL